MVSLLPMNKEMPLKSSGSQPVFHHQHKHRLVVCRMCPLLGCSPLGFSFRGLGLMLQSLHFWCLPLWGRCPGLWTTLESTTFTRVQERNLGHAVAYSASPLALLSLPTV